MELVLKRTDINEIFTVGQLYIAKCVDDEYLAGEEMEYLCDTLEPKVKELDLNGKRTLKKRAAIPEGRYPVVITHCERQDRWLPLLLGVPRFKDVRIQVGKTIEDIPVGGIIIGKYHGDGRIVNSPNMVYALKKLIVEAKAKGEGVWVKVKK